MTSKDFFPRLFGFAYRRTIRNLLPVRGYVKYNEVRVEPIKALDKYFSFFHKPMKDIPCYEDAIVDAINEHVTSGDTVVVVGGGYGVTVVRALQKIGKDGKLFCFEGSKEYVKYVQDSISYNEHLVPKESIIVENSFIGSSEHVYGTHGPGFPIESLPFCDVLELDCEGSEKMILSNLSYSPRVIIVETHGVYGATTEEVKTILHRKGYKIISERVAEKNFLDICIEKDIMVLVALKR
ncbi:hypothetical protein LQ567_20570 [Niabella pedocola]|uniref:Methyltransferase FkbM domain-containing protein n=1 Tax=Niabella pedocola TaxID=1752077 RepID=A0ABS8PY30_9BACT|nr:hypothetical protein [Niabella pedocola]MCD2425192.1 hypothetical protein [Niabella pedocola]